jgi:hypothetical protein
MESVTTYFSERLQRMMRAGDIDRWMWPTRHWKTRQLQPLLPRATISFEQKELEAARYGIDLRHPFGDRRLVDLLISLRCGIKSDPDTPKSLLVEALKQDLPSAIHTRPKSDYMEIVKRRVSCSDCLEIILTSKVRLPDVNYQFLFEHAQADPDQLSIFLLVNLARVHRFAQLAA